MNDLTKWDDIERQIDVTKDLKKLSAMHEQIEAIKIMSRQLDGSLKTVNKANKYKIKIEFAVGEIYKNLENKKDVKSSSSKLTVISDKQQAKKELNKSRQSINQYVKESNIENKDNLLNEYESECNEEKKEMSSSGFIDFAKSKSKKEKIENENKKRKEIITDIEIRKGDFKKVLSDVYNIDCIITDPPYPKDYLDCFSDLGLFAKEHLKKDGFLVCYSGQYHLPEVIKRLSENLTYVWTFCLYHKGKKQLINGVNIMCGWKPILIFSNGRKKMRFSAYDIVISEDREKHSHEWQQSESGIESLIEIFTEPGMLICDPFSGAGTFGKVSKDSGRNFIGAEIND